ncbi:MAG: hypothetical protein EHM35_21475 [Planctomycetaceae bacterium]|nr:MAG: hypothetical protein EHM35_21475 [Planctomycetaceae bacterium]
MAKEAENGFTATPDKKGVSLHLTWAMIALALGGSGLLGGRTFMAGRSTLDRTIVMTQDDFNHHCEAQADTEKKQGEKLVELGAKVDAMREDLRDIKGMLMRQRSDTGRPRIGEAGGT